MLLGIKFVDISFSLYMKCYPRIPHFLKTFLQILNFFSPHTLFTFLHDSGYNQYTILSVICRIIHCILLIFIVCRVMGFFGLEFVLSRHLAFLLRPLFEYFISSFVCVCLLSTLFRTNDRQNAPKTRRGERKRGQQQLCGKPQTGILQVIFSFNRHNNNVNNKCTVTLFNSRSTRFLNLRLRDLRHAHKVGRSLLWFAFKYEYKIHFHFCFFGLCFFFFFKNSSSQKQFVETALLVVGFST